MIKKINFVAVILVFQLDAITQQVEKFKFNSINQFGCVTGAFGNALQVQTINGVSYKNFYAGAGIGLDYYYIRSIPAFLDVRKTIGSKNKAPFVYVSAGYNFPWLSNGDKGMLIESRGFVTNAKAGLYYDAGIGYQVPVLKKSSLFFSAGYSTKKFSTISYSAIAIDIYPPQPPVYNQYNYTLRRISIKAGLLF